MLLRSFITFVVFYFLLRQVQTQPSTCVTCINCQDLYDGTDINSTCSSTVPNADSCQKMRIQLPGTTLIAKACARNCREQSIIAGAIRLDVSCCTTSNCNIANILFHQRTQFLLSVMIIFLFILL